MVLEQITPNLPPNVVNAIFLTAEIGAAILIIGVFFILALRYNVQVRIFAQRGNGITVLSDLGRIVKNKDTNRPELFKALFSRKTGPYPGGQYLFPKKGLFQKHMLLFHEDAQGDFHPIALRQNSPINLEVDPTDVRFWFGETMHKNAEEFTKQSFWQKYGNVVLQFSFMIIMFVLFFLLIIKFGEVGELLSNAASGLSKLA